MDKLDLYKCDICSNLVEVVLVGGGQLVCCGQPMNKLEAKTTEEAMFEKHIPVFVKNEQGLDEVRVGEVLHPMIEEHYITFIETISEDKNRIERQFLYPGDTPKMIVKNESEKLFAREFCNIHGLWEAYND